MKMKARGTDARLAFHQRRKFLRRIRIPGIEKAGGLELIGRGAAQAIQHQGMVIAIRLGLHEQSPVDPFLFQVALIGGKRVGADF